jgi:hypothetical protein
MDKDMNTLLDDLKDPFTMKEYEKNATATDSKYFDPKED